MKPVLIRLWALFALVSLACTVSFNLPASRTGETQTLTLNESPPAASPARVEIAMLGGSLNISGGGENLVTGTIDYNLAEWKPEVTREDDTVRIAQQAKTVPVPSDGEMVNRWNLQLGDTPMFLSLQAGAYDGTINLSGVPLTGLDISGGASDSEIRFDTPNPQAMDSFSYRTGASNVEIYGLGNASPAIFNFTCGAGDYLLDFSGTLQRPITAEVTGALGSLSVIIPPDVSAQVNLTGGLRDVNLEGEWSQAGDRYTAAGSGPRLLINIEMSIGQLNLSIR